MASAVALAGLKGRCANANFLQVGFVANSSLAMRSIKSTQTMTGGPAQGDRNASCLRSSRTGRPDDRSSA